jgi:hypothetical protein
MFERYTERARRVLFFARYEASHTGSISIETEHLLLGLLREGKGVTGRIFARSRLSSETVRKEIEGRMVFRERLPTSVEIPFSAECKRVLGYAAEEADRLLHNYIGTEHLLLGILREERSVAGSILHDSGMRLTTVRDDIVQLLNETTTRTGTDFEAHVGTTIEQERHHFEPLAGARMLRLLVRPDYVPSLVVHITYSDLPPDQQAWTQHAGQAWRAFGFTLAEIVAYAWGSEPSYVKLAAPCSHDDTARYDFAIVLPPAARGDVIPGLLREAVERNLDVEVTGEGGDPPMLVVRPRSTS